MEVDRIDVGRSSWTTRHTGKKVIVTGAGNGIGRATVLRLAREGANVVGCDVNEAALTETAGVLETEGLTAQLIPADVTVQGTLTRLIAAAGSDLGIVANVAGIMDHFLPLGEMTDEMWNRVMDVNVTGVMRLSRAAIPVFEANGAGCSSRSVRGPHWAVARRGPRMQRRSTQSSDSCRASPICTGRRDSIERGTSRRRRHSYLIKCDARCSVGI